MVSVYVWRPGGQNTGHASLLVEPTYISWWPDSSKKFLSAPGEPKRTLAEDTSEEGHPPDWTVQIHGLDEGAMRRFWEGFLLMRHDWQLHNLNCAKAVVLALKAGGADDRIGMGASLRRNLAPITAFVSPLIAYNIAGVQGIATAFQGDGFTIGYRGADWFTPVWTPLDALRYAQSID